MLREELDEPLAHRSGGAEDADGELAHMNPIFYFSLSPGERSGGGEARR
jgi:hypothetical protein